MCNF